MSVEQRDVIWTLDRVCGYGCDFCCVDAFSVRKNGNSVGIKSNSLDLTIPSSTSGTPYMQAESALIERGLALSVEEKLKVLDNLRGVNLQLGFSGGDLLLVRDNLEVVKKASELFGRENIGLTATGMGMRIGKIQDYFDYIAQVEFTYDGIEDSEVNHNQLGYNNSNLRAFMELCRGKVTTQALIPISRSNASPAVISNLYTTLRDAGVDKVYLMRTFPVGRGAATAEDLGAETYRATIEEYRRLQQELSGPEVNIMCALKNLFPGSTENPCTFFKSTVDITSTGNAIVDAFAYNQFGEALDPDLILGDLKTDRLVDILSQDRVQSLAARVDENFGHCKIFAYLSDTSKGLDGFFQKTDPLYIDTNNNGK